MVPKVSVIIVTYNRARQLRKALATVFNQTYQDFEVVVVDDASTDDTATVVGDFSDIRLNYVRHDVNKRTAAARNTGIQQSKGQYIAFLDDDDEWCRDKLRRQVELIEESPSNIGAVYTGIVEIDNQSGSTLAKVIPTRRGYIFNDLISENVIATSSILLRKDCFLGVGLFDEGIVFGEDHDMWIRIAKQFQFDFVGDPLVKYYVHNNRMSSNYSMIISGTEAFIRKYGQVLALDNQSYSAQYYRLGVYYCLFGQPHKGRQNLLKAINLYPYDLRYYFRFALSLLGSKNYKRGHEIRDRIAGRFSSKKLFTG